jgi:hypothetical protein
VLCNKRKKCASLGGVVVATRGNVKEGFSLSLGISWLSGVLLFVRFLAREVLRMCVLYAEVTLYLHY